MAEIDFIQALHATTRRDYIGRVVEHDKADSAAVAKQFGRDYWDGERRYGYGGYGYDGRWRPIAERMAAHYGLKPGDRILDVGCGKGYLLYEFTQAVPGIEVAGIDVSDYGIANARAEVKPFLTLGTAADLPWADNSFDFVVSLGCLHNLYIYDCWRAAAEIERVGTGRGYIMVESYRDEREKANLLYWQLTCECFFTPREWDWMLTKAGYTGDHGFIFFM